MRSIALLLLLAASASCGSSPLTPGGAPDPNQPTAQPDGGPAALSDADCTAYNPIACRLDVAKTSVAIDVNYPNLIFCRLQFLPSSGLLSAGPHTQLAAAWDVSLTTATHDQQILTAEQPHAVLEYPLGSEQLYLTRVTIASKTGDTLATLIANTLGPDVSLFAVTLGCPGH
ncbi:MAG TPA: hypothetical protein VIF57_05190 [Polyangia bacterium]|jgi:hypothetical protein